MAGPLTVDNARLVAVALQVLSLAVLVGISLYPNEWGALTDFKDDKINALQGLNTRGITSAGFDERFNIQYIAPENLVHAQGTKGVVSTITLKCGDYSIKKNDFETRCEEIKFVRPAFATGVVLMIVLGMAQLNGGAEVHGLKCGSDSLLFIRVLVAGAMMAFASLMLHNFEKEEENIGKLNKHGKAYFGLLVAFSVLLFVGQAAGLVVAYKSTTTTGNADAANNLMDPLLIDTKTNNDAAAAGWVSKITTPNAKVHPLLINNGAAAAAGWMS